MNSLDIAFQYAADVRDGKIIVNRYIQLAIDRHFKDLENIETSGYYFSKQEATAALWFFDLLALTKGVTGGAAVNSDNDHEESYIPFKLEPWQSFMIASLFGWKKRSDGKRRFTEAYIEIPKKNGKTTIAAGIANYMLILDGEAEPEVYLAAYTRDQASICFDEAVSQIKNSPELRAEVNFLKYSVTVRGTRAKMTAVSHEASNLEGKNSHAVILDEYHVHKNDLVKDSLQSGQAARKQPLLFIITTAGYNKQGPCYKHRDLCIGMLEGKYQLDNVFSLIFGIDEGDNWKDEETWVKANPSLGVTVQMDYLRREFQKALRSGSKEVDFKTKHLNLWVDSAATWIPSEIWNSLARPDFIPPKDAICYGGLDLAQSEDICAFTLYFPEYHYLTHQFYVPRIAAENSARGGIDYSDWVRAGHLRVCSTEKGRIVDYDYIINDIYEACDTYNVHFIGYDAWGAKLLAPEINRNVDPRWGTMRDQKGKYHDIMQPASQKLAYLSGASKFFMDLALEEKIIHDGNPVMAWMLSNVDLMRDSNNNIKPDKKTSKDKIDGVISSIIAINQYLNCNQDHVSPESVGIY
jgi:phage terminase large subunit-like protein